MSERLCRKCGAKIPPGSDACGTCAFRDRAPDSDSTHSASTELLLPSTRIGPYRILERIGEGGMGAVYLADQEEPFRRRVALKVIRQGMQTREVIARFEAERQALALMDHPCIAQVYDAGTTPEGAPYFVMEYVPGVPITEYCDRHRLSVSTRLELFVQVCSAIQHAHQKAVIHRDIKPSNVLVTVHDGKAIPKVIDFGLAKALNQRLTEKTLFTQHGVLIGTPAYMSPEQAEMSELDVDTTTDIYSLGVVLYELLIGALPFDADLLRRAGYAEMQRIIREEEPLRPSARLTSRHPTAPAVALQRQTQVPALLRQLKGDLDWIALKAIAKDRTRRYASASELAADVERHLKTEPVVARPPSLTYRASKFARKYRGMVVSVAITVIASTLISTALQMQIVVRGTAAQILEQARSAGRNVEFRARGVTVRDAGGRVILRTNDDGLRATLQAALFAPAVSGATICDTRGRVLLSWDGPAGNDCPAGRPARDLVSVSLSTLMRGALPSKTESYVLSTPLRIGSDDIGLIQIQLSGLLMRAGFMSALRPTLLSCLIQLFTVGFGASVAGWFVFRPS